MKDLMTHYNKIRHIFDQRVHDALSTIEKLYGEYYQNIFTMMKTNANDYGKIKS